MIFTLWFQDQALKERIEPLLGNLPRAFVFKFEVGTPDGSYLQWDQFSDMYIPDAPNTFYIFTTPKPKYFAGCAFGKEHGSRGCVHIDYNLPDKTMWLRVYHELLHAINIDSDLMVKESHLFLPAPVHILFRLYCALWDVDIDFWHEVYYNWLIEQYLKR